MRTKNIREIYVSHMEMRDNMVHWVIPGAAIVVLNLRGRKNAPIVINQQRKEDSLEEIPKLFQLARVQKPKKKSFLQFLYDGP